MMLTHSRFISMYFKYAQVKVFIYNLISTWQLNHTGVTLSFISIFTFSAEGKKLNS